MARLVVRQFKWQRFMQHLPASALGAVVFSKFLHHVDRPIMSISGGRWSIPALLTGLPVVILKSIGATSGEQRIVPTIGVPDGNNIVLVASNWGQRRNPAWYYNLLKNPEAVLVFDGYEAPYIAREILDLEDYERLWRMAVNVYRGYEKYRQRVGNRRIPLVSLSPKGGDG